MFWAWVVADLVIPYILLHTHSLSPALALIYLTQCSRNQRPRPFLLLSHAQNRLTSIHCTRTSSTVLSSEVQAPHSQIPQLVRVRISSPSLILLKPVPPHGKEQEVVSFPHSCHHQMTEKAHCVSSSALTPSGLAHHQQGELYCPLSDKLHSLLSCTHDLGPALPLAPSSLTHQCPLPKVSALQCFSGKGQGLLY